MNKSLFLYLFLFFFQNILGQTTVIGQVTDRRNTPLDQVEVYFKYCNHGDTTDKHGRFKVKAPTSKDTLIVSYLGYKEQFIAIEPNHKSKLKIVLESDNNLKEIKIYSGKTSKKNNPAIDILRKIWANKRKNGLYKFKQYHYQKYEKTQVSLNALDSTFVNNPVIQKIDIISNNLVDDKKSNNAKAMPLFITERVYNSYGDNILNTKKDIIFGSKSSGFSTNEFIAPFLDYLYVDYNIYDNYIKIFDKDFISPLSKTGIQVYNYVLTDTTLIDNKKAYNIVFYPRRKGEPTFKGDFWVNEDTWAIKEIQMQTSQDLNLNWVRNFSIEQSFKLMNDSVYLLSKDVLDADFSVSKNSAAKGVNAKRSTFFSNHQFNIEKPRAFYLKEVNNTNRDWMNRNDQFWTHYRKDSLNQEEKGIYKMLDGQSNDTKFQNYLNVATLLGSGYWEVKNFDIGPVYSFYDNNKVEGHRLRFGGRTYFGQNDLWRLEGYLAYGFRDQKIKYALAGKAMLFTKKRLMLYGGHRNDIEIFGNQLTTTLVDILGKPLSPASLITVGGNSRFIAKKVSEIGLSIEPVKNLQFSTSVKHQQIHSVMNEVDLRYFTNKEKTKVSDHIQQGEINFSINYTPKRNPVGYGVDQPNLYKLFPQLYINYSLGIKTGTDSYFDYKKIQLYYRHPILAGGFGWLTPTFEAGKTFGAVPLALLHIIPSNPSYFIQRNGFSQLNFMEFVADTYVTLHLEHNFNGRLLSRIPFIRAYSLREFAGIRMAYGTISKENKDLNASRFIYRAPEDKIYYEYFVGIGNIFKVLRIDVTWRGNYLNAPNIQKIGVNAAIKMQF